MNAEFNPSPADAAIALSKDIVLSKELIVDNNEDEDRQANNEEPEASTSTSPKLKTDEQQQGANTNSSDSDKNNSAEDDPQQEEEATFPQQLMDVIDSETNDGSATVDGERILEWLPDGDAFVIRDKKAFERDVLPNYFSAKCKFMSFVRKLYRQVF